MNELNGMKISEGEKWIARNPQNLQYEEIDHMVAELPIGSYVLRLSWSNECQRHVTTAGSLYKMSAYGLVMESES